MGAHKSSFEQKVEWLVRHPDLCRIWPRYPWSDKEVIAAMRRDGLVSAGAHDYDLGDLGKPMAEARARLRSASRSAHNVWR